LVARQRLHLSNRTFAPDAHGLLDSVLSDRAQTRHKNSIPDSGAFIKIKPTSTALADL
jgi:hypothetical protein